MRHDDPMSRRITSAEAARITGRSRSQINRDAATGRLAVLEQYPGRTGPRLFDEAEVRRFYQVAS
jgi:hypothetical protein